MELIDKLARYEVEDRGYETPCWIWQGADSGRGYGHVWIDGQHRYAHRAAWEAAYGPIPHGMEIDHKCRVRACINPDHLRAATKAQNMQNLNPRGLRGSRSRFRGVGLTDSGRWRAYGRRAGRYVHIGVFDDEATAAAAAADFRRSHMPFSIEDRGVV